MLMSWKAHCCVWGGFEPVFDQFLALALAFDFRFSFGCLDGIFISFGKFLILNTLNFQSNLLN